MEKIDSAVMKFIFVTKEGARVSGCTSRFAHKLLLEYAEERGLKVHLHEGGWAGNALSVAYDPHGDMLLDCKAAVRSEK